MGLQMKTARELAKELLIELSWAHTHSHITTAGYAYAHTELTKEEIIVKALERYGQEEYLRALKDTLKDAQAVLEETKK